MSLSKYLGVDPLDLREFMDFLRFDSLVPESLHLDLSSPLNLRKELPQLVSILNSHYGARVYGDLELFVLLLLLCLQVLWCEDVH